MSVKSQGWYFHKPNGRDMSILYPAKQACLQQIVYHYAVTRAAGPYELVNARLRIDRYGEMEQDDVTHGLVSRSRSAKYRAVFRPDEYGPYEYSYYYVSDKGSLIPKR